MKVEPLKTTQNLFSAQGRGKDSRKDENKVGDEEGGRSQSKSFQFGLTYGSIYELSRSFKAKCRK